MSTDKGRAHADGLRLRVLGHELREPVPHSVYVAFDEPLDRAGDVPAALGRLFHRTLEAVPGTPDAA